MDQSDEKLIININTATVRELTLLPDIGESMAQRIVDYRREKGPFPDCDSLLNIPGIGPGTLRKILPYIIAGG